MKWFRHLTTAGDDDFLVSVLEQFGLAGIGAWWSLVERIGRQVKDPQDVPRIRVSVPGLARNFRTNRAWLLRVLNHFQAWGKITIEDSGALVEISMPKILKYTDEWVRKVRSKSGAESGADPEPVRSESGETPVKERKKEKKEKKERKETKSPESAPPGLSPGAPLPESVQAARESLKAALATLPGWSKGQDKGNGQETAAAPPGGSWEVPAYLAGTWAALNQESRDVILSMAVERREMILKAQADLLEKRRQADERQPEPVSDNEKFLQGAE